VARDVDHDQRFVSPGFAIDLASSRLITLCGHDVKHGTRGVRQPIITRHPCDAQLLAELLTF